LEAEIYEAPKVDKLLSEKPVAAAPKEAVISKTPDKGRAAKPGENIVDTNNRTETGTALPPSHGPIVVYSPQPSIPQYMRDQALKASVVIDFTITATGEASPRLVNSSGNEELDAIALKTAKTWRFKAAAKENHPVDSKIRLRIVFEVN
jgi:TonB family protein